jgi:hypothetical protein
MEIIIYVVIVLLLVSDLILERKIDKRAKQSAAISHSEKECIMNFTNLRIDTIYAVIKKHEKEMHQARDRNGKFLPKRRKLK